MAGTDFSHLTNDELIKGIQALKLPDYIRSKAYGIDVRETLAQMTEMTIQLGVNMGLSPDDALEMVKKLQDIDVQLVQKVGLGKKAELEDLSPSVLSAIEGGEGTSFNLLSVPQDKSVSPEKTDFIMTSLNLFNPDTRVLNTAISYDDGSLEYSGSNDTSDFIKVNPGQQLSFTGVSRVGWYDNSKAWIDTVAFGSALENTTTVPPNAYYCILTIYRARLLTAQINKGSVLAPYSSYHEPILSDKIRIKGGNLEDVQLTADDTDFIRESFNLFDKSTVTSGHYIEPFSGNLVESNSNSTSDFIDIEPDTEYYLDVDDISRIRVAYFNDSNAFVDGVAPTTNSITTPALAKKMRFSFRALDLDSVQLIKGNAAKPYEPYGVYFFQKPVQLDNNDTDVGETSKFNNTTMLFFGDSLTGMYVDHAAYPAKVKDILGLKEAFNVGFSGTRMSKVGGTRYTAFSLTSLVDAVVSDDWTLQDEYVDDRTNYEDHLATLKSVDFSEVDVVSLFYGANDYGGSVPLDNELDAYDVMTYAGACRYAIKQLTEKYPHLRFVIISPAYRKDTDGIANNAGLKMEDYFGAVKSVHEDLGVPLLDIFHNGQINRLNYATYLQPDGLHFDQNKGLPRIATAIASQMESYL